MNINYHQNGHILHCHIQGDMTVETSSDIKRSFMKNIRSSKWNILINLKGVTKTDVAGIATLIEFTKILKELGGSLKLAELPENILDLLEITKSRKLFEIYESDEDALRHF